MPNPRIISLPMLRVSGRLASASSYETPSPAWLATEIVEGKKRLDETTHFEKIVPHAACLTAAPALSRGDRYALKFDSALPLSGEFSHRLIAGRHVWISVEQGTLIVLDDSEDSQMRRLVDGLFPTSSGKDFHALVGRLAAAGFIRGIRGYTDAVVPDARRFLRIHLTERCNLTCIHCYADSSPYVSSEGELSRERWLTLISDFAALGGERVLFTGGEALVHSGCLDLMAHAHSLRLHVTLFTNGILLPRHIDRIAATADEVQVSIDGPTAESNDPIRGIGSFQAAVHAVDLLSERRIAVRISTVVMHQNWDAIKSGYLDFARRWAGSDVSFRINYGLMEHGRGEDLPPVLDINETRPVVDLLMSQLHPGDEQRILRRAHGCGYAEQIVVAPNGDIHPCHLLDGALANIDDGSLIEVLHRIRHAQEEYDVDHNVGCGTCDIRHLCGGTCRVENGKKTGNRRVTYCSADEKLRKLVALKELFDPTN